MSELHAVLRDPILVDSGIARLQHFEQGDTIIIEDRKIA